ncbi:MAG: dihydrodipicolinate synthase family protein [Patescibacteria group bacterium]|nr:dihydrodipicolinate synthase family protein [Patescibacteria group bacterium]MDD4611332.1 dihydrodipicolinate synthase family protein [Patescibacteria group bacterium]
MQRLRLLEPFSEGVTTSLITPRLRDNQKTFDQEGFAKLCQFQAINGIPAILAAGKIGERSTLSPDDYYKLVGTLHDNKGVSLDVIGVGTSDYQQSEFFTGLAGVVGTKVIWILDFFPEGLNGDEVMREFYAPLAEKFPQSIFVVLWEYKHDKSALLPTDGETLMRKHQNVQIVQCTKYNSKVHPFCQLIQTEFGSPHPIYVLDNNDPAQFIYLSAMANIAPKAINDMVRSAKQGKKEEALRLYAALKPLLNTYGLNSLRAWHQQYNNRPGILKTAMEILGMPAGPCMSPLGKVDKNAVWEIHKALCLVWREHPEILQPAADFFKLDLDERLHRPPESWAEILYYKNAY